MAFGAVYDAAVLYPYTVRDLLIRLAAAGEFRAYWTNEILDETFRSILAKNPDLDQGALARTRALMVRAVPDCLVTGYEGIMPSLTLPDANDRHVLAAAIRAGAQVIVTYNLKDFPPSALEPFNIEAKHPDVFIVETIDLMPPGVVAKIISEQSADMKVSIPQLLEMLRNRRLIQTVARLRTLFGTPGG